jgi:hypothetical protein
MGLLGLLVLVFFFILQKEHLCANIKHGLLMNILGARIGVRCAFFAAVATYIWNETFGYSGNARF